MKNATTPSTYETYLSLTAPRSLVCLILFLCMMSLTHLSSQMSAPKPLVKLQFTSLIVPETTAKESRVKLSLWGFTCNFFPYVDWVSDLVLFAKAPPGVCMPMLFTPLILTLDVLRHLSPLFPASVRLCLSRSWMAQYGLLHLATLEP